MADRYDPRASARTDRKYAEMNQSEKSENDPLAELARMVSGRGGSGTQVAPRRPASATQVASGQAGMLGDLEAELLNNLQASFTAVKDAAPVPTRPAMAPPPPAATFAPLPPVAAAPEPVAPSPSPRAADGIVRDRLTDALAALAPVLKFERPPEPAQPAAPAVASPERGAAMDADNGPIMGQAAANRLRDALNAVAPQPVPVPSAEAGFARMDAERAPLRAVPVPSVEPSMERSPLRVAAQVDRIDLPNLNLRAAQAAQEARARNHSRWEKPAEAARTAVGPSRFAPPKMSAAPAPAEEEDEDAYEASPFATLQAVQQPPPVEPTADDINFAQAALEDETPADPDFSGYLRRRAHRRRLFASVVGVTVLAAGGIAFAMLRGGPTDSLPRIITDDGGPSKVVPTVTASKDPAQGKLDYINVGTPTAGGTVLLTSPTQVAPVPKSDPGSTGAIASLITDAAGAPTDQPATEPRKVRTVVVKPDGTIVSSDATDAPTPVPGAPGVRPATPGQTGTAAPATTAAGARPATAPPTAAAAAPTVAGGRPVTTPPTVAAAPPPAPAQTGTATPTVRQAVPNPVGPTAAGAPSATSTTAAAGAKPAAGNTGAAPPAAPTPAAPSAPANETLRVAGAGAGSTSNGELLITPNAPVGVRPSPPAPTAAPTVTAANQPKPAPAAPGPLAQAPAPKPAGQQIATVASGGMMVQMSSQRTEEGARATFKDLQVRYQKILGPYEVNVQRADLGDKGVFYRARVGPFSAADAKRLCDDLKGAGGDCIIVGAN